MPEHSWTDLNSSGLAYAQHGEWNEAASAFAAAMQLLSDDAHDPRAVLATNTAISLFEQGQLDEAIACATASHDARSSMWGAQSMACVRAQADLAVMLAVAGRTADARQLIHAALDAVQSFADDEHPQMLLLIENAARIALMQGDFGSAEPLVLRLHALLDANGEATTGADALFAMIAAARNVREEVVTAPSAGLEMDLDLVEPTPATLDFVPEHRRNVHRDDDALGFVVQHGLTVQPDEPESESSDDLLTADIGPLPELAMPAAEEIALVEPPRTLQQTPSLTLTRGVHVRRSAREIPVVMPSPAHSQAAIRDFDDPDDDAHPRNALHVPSANVGAVADKSPVVLQDRPRIRASGGARVWLVVGGGLAAVAAAAAWYAIRPHG